MSTMLQLGSPRRRVSAAVVPAFLVRRGDGPLGIIRTPWGQDRRRKAGDLEEVMTAMEAIAYFRNQFVPLAEAKVSIVTHALNYGTGCFEGIRGNWNADAQQLYLFRPREHFERLTRSCGVMKMRLPCSPAELVELTREL